MNPCEAGKSAPSARGLTLESQLWAEWAVGAGFTSLRTVSCESWMSGKCFENFASLSYGGADGLDYSVNLKLLRTRKSLRTRMGLSMRI
jgi:hypothetical protein